RRPRERPRGRGVGKPGETWFPASERAGGEGGGVVIAYAARRSVAALVQLLIITFVAYLLFFLIADLTGANPAQRVAGKGATPARVRELAHVMGTDRPWDSQYAHFLGHVARGDLGYSFQRRQPVSAIVFPAAGVTASPVLGA